MTEKRRLEREPGTARPRTGRLERAPKGREDDEREEADDGIRPIGRRSRPSIGAEVGDVNRGVLFVGVESAAIALDVFSRVLRGVVDRAFDEDYSSPGDLVRGIAAESDHAVYDLVAEVRNVPRKLSHRFEDAVRSPRADQGERARRTDAGATTPADSPSNKTEKA